MYKIIFHHELQQLLRNKMQLIVLIIIIFFGLYALYYGNHEIGKQKNRINNIEENYAQEMKEYLICFDADTSTAQGKEDLQKVIYPSKTRFNFYFYAFFKPCPLAALAIGQRDLSPYYTKLNAQSLYLQLFKSEITNPQKLLAGNIDLAFVFIYLFPLLIIAFSYNLLSGEKEKGTFSLLKVHAFSIRRIIILKVVFYYILVLVLAILFSFTGFFISGLTSVSLMFSWILAIALYLLVWSSLCLCISAFNQSSSMNAMLLLSSWLLMLIVIPSVINTFGEMASPVNQSTLTNVLRRKNMESTDSAMNNVLNRFYKEFPGYAIDTTHNEYFYYKGYSAFLALEDKHDRVMVETYYQSIEQRDQLQRTFNWINPGATIYQITVALAHTDFTDIMNYRRAVGTFHKAIWDFSNKPLFKNQLMKKENFFSMPVFQLQYENSVFVLLLGFLQLLLVSLVFFIPGFYKLKLL